MQRSGLDEEVAVQPLGPSGHAGRDLGGVVFASVATSLPVFLVGALAVQMRPSLHLGVNRLGLAVSIYYVAATVASVPAGRFAEFVGGARVLRFASSGAAISLAMITFFARSWISLAGVLVLSGLTNATTQPAANLFLVRRMPRERQGLAFGIRQASVPFAALLAGLAVPTVGLTIGWRWAFAIAACFAAASVFVLPRPRRSLAETKRAHRAADSSLVLVPLLVLTVAFSLGMFATTGLTTFLVTSLVAAGVGKALAGIIAAIAGAAAVVSRVFMGVRADRRPGNLFHVVGAMLLAGAVGYVGLAVGSATGTAALLAVGAVAAYAAGWGWNALFSLAVARSHAHAPAKASGVTLTGNRLAGVIGPILFALVVSHSSYAVAWAVAAAAALVAAGVMVLGDHLLARAGAASVAAAALPAEPRSTQ